MSDAPVPPTLPVPIAEGDAHRSLRDLMGLMTLPALWAGQNASTVLRLMTEAVEHLVRLDMSYIDVQAIADEPAITGLRVGGVAATGAELLKWKDAISSLGKMAITSAPALHETPAGRLRVVRVSMGFSARGGSVWFGSAEPTFPTLTQSAFLRTAATLAATGVQSARVDHERERASRAKNEFLAMLGHELRNPLAPIFTSLELIKRQSDQPLDRPHAIIERQARHLSRLVDDLLDVSRISHGKVELHKAHVELRAILVNALEAVEPIVAQRRHVVTAAYPDRSMLLWGDATRLTQVFVNLLTNAAKYTPANGKIWLETSVEGDAAIVCVRDTGDGISPELMPRLFGIFEQGFNTIDRAGGGLGIGLALVKDFVALHDGTVVATSAGVGTGSTFTVRLPLAPSIADTPGTRPCETVEIATPKSRQARASEGLRVMLVDDNVDALELTAELLRDSGFEVAAAHDSVEALALLKSFGPAVVVVDIGLPIMDGYQLAAELRRRSSPGALRLIAMSAYGQPEDHRRSLATGFERHLVKPVDADALVRAIQRGF